LSASLSASVSTAAPTGTPTPKAPTLTQGVMASDAQNAGSLSSGQRCYLAARRGEKDAPALLHLDSICSLLNRRLLFEVPVLALDYPNAISHNLTGRGNREPDKGLVELWLKLSDGA